MGINELALVVRKIAVGSALPTTMHKVIPSGLFTRVRRLALKGGPGSGNFGHAGRPGKVGGSASRAGYSEHWAGRDVTVSSHLLRRLDEFFDERPKLTEPLIKDGVPRECQENARREYWAQKKAGKDPVYVEGQLRGLDHVDVLRAADFLGEQPIMVDTESWLKDGVQHAWVEVDGQIVDATPFLIGPQGENQEPAIGHFEFAQYKAKTRIGADDEHVLEQPLTMPTSASRRLKNSRGAKPDDVRLGHQEPQDKAEQGLKDVLATYARMGASQAIAVGTEGHRSYSNVADMVLQEGRWFTPQALPKGIKRGKSKRCYQNAYQLSQTRDDLTYVEGFAFSDLDIDLPFEHAWSVDRAGRVFDNTWRKPGRAYFGIALSRDFVIEQAGRNGVYGVFGMESQGARKILKHGLPSDLKGGPGSGNFGHAGRPGLVGGSAPGTMHSESAPMSLGSLGAEWDKYGAQHPKGEAHPKWRQLMVARLAKRLDKDGPIQQVQQAEFSHLVDQVDGKITGGPAGTHLKRSLKPRALRELVNGDYQFDENSVYGSGYMLQQTKGHNSLAPMGEVLFHGILAPDAKRITLSEVKQRMSDESGALFRLQEVMEKQWSHDSRLAGPVVWELIIDGKAPPDIQEKADHFENLHIGPLRDPGWWALANGYDVIDVDTGIVILLNRSKVIMPELSPAVPAHPPKDMPIGTPRPGGLAPEPHDALPDSANVTESFFGRRLDQFEIEKRGEWKDTICADLSNLSGVSYEKVSNFIQQWARTTNDDDARAIQIQRTVEAVFGSPRSAWQIERQRDVETDIVKLGDKQEDWDVSETEGQAIIKAMYNRTQELLRVKGIGDHIRLYRGYIEEQKGQRIPAIGSRIRYRGNSSESWTTDAHVAQAFAVSAGMRGMVFAMDVPVENILATAFTGFGCLNEFEFVVMPGKKSYAKVVGKTHTPIPYTGLTGWDKFEWSTKAIYDEVGETVVEIDSDANADWMHSLPGYASELTLSRARAKGGPGSGNFGHAGRPGKVGGSAPGAAHTPPPAGRDLVTDVAQVLATEYPMMPEPNEGPWPTPAERDAWIESHTPAVEAARAEMDAYIDKLRKSLKHLAGPYANGRFANEPKFDGSNERLGSWRDAVLALGYRGEGYNAFAMFRYIEAVCGDQDTALVAMGSMEVWNLNPYAAVLEWEAAYAVGGATRPKPKNWEPHGYYQQKPEDIKLTPTEEVAYRARLEFVGEFVRESQGETFEAYRGVRGAYAKKLKTAVLSDWENGADMEVRALSSWSTNKHDTYFFAYGKSLKPNSSGLVITDQIGADEVWMINTLQVHSPIKFSEDSGEVILLGRKARHLTKDNFK